MERAQNGDVGAFEVLVVRHQAFITATAMRVVRNQATAEDIAQEAFFRAWRALPGFRGDAQFRSWVYRIATNLALNHIERKRDIPVEEMPEIGTNATAEESAIEHAITDAWEVAIGQLAPELREPYLMRERDGTSYEQIAAELGVPLNTVRTRIHRARRRVGDAMKTWR